MEDCKCGRIPPCYSGKKFRIHEELEKIKAGDETREMVYELNKQMCDPLDPPSEDTMKKAADTLESHLKTMRELNRKRMLPIEVTEEHIKIINRFMEEKKTKWMTKDEAFEYLKGKKVNAKDKDRVVQMKMFDCGIKWRCGESVYYNFGSHLFIDNEGFLSHCGDDKEYWKRHAYEEISADDILSIEIVEEKHELEFNYDKVVELAKPLMHYLDEVGCSDGIRVSQYGIAHEPMSTLIFDNGIGE